MADKAHQMEEVLIDLLAYPYRLDYQILQSVSLTDDELGENSYMPFASSAFPILLTSASEVVELTCIHNPDSKVQASFYNTEVLNPITNETVKA